MMTRLLRNLIRGAGSVVDLAPAPRHVRVVNPASMRTDAEAMRGDWLRVGDDIRAAIAPIGSKPPLHVETGAQS